MVLLTVTCRAKISSISGVGVEIELIFTCIGYVFQRVTNTRNCVYTTSGTFADDQLSCPSVAILETELYIGNHCPWSQNKLIINLFFWG